MSPRTRRRQLKRWERAMESFVETRLGGWLAVNVASPIDRRLLRWTKGRLGTFPGQPVGLLETTGAKSGQPRSTPLLYLEDGGRIVLVASKAGSLSHPAWYHNLRANPEVFFSDRRGRRLPYRARDAEGEERQRLWAEVNDLYVGYDTYQERAGARRIPVVVLEPR